MGPVVYAEEEVHSTSLIAASDLVIIYSSSIVFEAVLQRKPICNATYLLDNPTILDSSEVVVNAKNHAEVIELIRTIQKGEYKLPSADDCSEFICAYIEGGVNGKDVLSEYVDLLTGDAR